MKNLIKQVVAPVLSLVIFTLGNGLFTTFVSLRLKMDHQSTVIIGFVTAAFFAGIVIGSIRVHHLIERIGHIRLFSAFAALTAVIAILQGLFINVWAWMFLRFLTGYLLAGLFITIESWLLAQGTIKTKGKILSIYMISYYGAQAAGQFFLSICSYSDVIPYALTALFAAFSVVPVCLTKTTAPIMKEPSYLNIFKLFRLSSIGILGSVISGIVLGSIYGLLPIYAKDRQMDLNTVAMVMGLTIFGGLLLQWPLGHISDHVDRRKVILATSFFCALVCLLIAFLNSFSITLFFILIIIFGGLSFTLYPLSICHASDLVEEKDIVSATGALNLAYGLGAIIGPVGASYTMHGIGSEGFFYFTAIVVFLLGSYILYKVIRVKPVPKDEKVPYRNLPRTTPMASELDPQQESKDKEKKKE